jgi:two-component system, NarL family, response regulator DevR
VDGAIRVAVVDDHPSIGLAIQAAITASGAGSPTLAFAWSARSVEEARARLAGGTEPPHVVICDAQLQAGLDGLDVIELARAAGARAIVFTSFDRSSLMRAAFDRGASGFLDKSAEADEIVSAIRAVASGGTAFSASALDAARRAPRPPSMREIAVLHGVRDGSTSDEIGRALSISTRTVESHLRRMFDRYGVVSRTELAVLAIEEGWIEASG